MRMNLAEDSSLIHSSSLQQYVTAQHKYMLLHDTAHHKNDVF